MLSFDNGMHCPSDGIQSMIIDTISVYHLSWVSIQLHLLCKALMFHPFDHPRHFGAQKQFDWWISFSTDTVSENICTGCMEKQEQKMETDVKTKNGNEMWKSCAPKKVDLVQEAELEARRASNET